MRGTPTPTPARGGASRAGRPGSRCLSAVRRCTVVGSTCRALVLRSFILCLLSIAVMLGTRPAFAGSVFLEDLTWTELRDRIGAGSRTVLVPIGGTEQNGPDIALGKHNARVRELARLIAERLGQTLVAPVMAYVPEGSIDPPTGHMRFPGTLTIPADAFEKMLEATARSLESHGFSRIVFLGDHGGYQSNLAAVVRRLDGGRSHRRARVLAPEAYYRAASDEFAQILREKGFRDDEIGTHAGLADASLQLALAPETVRIERLRARAGVGAADGVHDGDPRRASAELGRIAVETIVTRTVAAIARASAER